MVETVIDYFFNSVHSSTPQENMIKWSHVVLTLSHRLQRWGTLNQPTVPTPHVSCDVCMIYAATEIIPEIITSWKCVMYSVWMWAPSKHDWSNVGFTLVHRLRRCPNIKPAFAECFALTVRCRPPANMRHWPNACSMLGHRLQRWPNIEEALGQCLSLLVGPLAVGHGLLQTLHNNSMATMPNTITLGHIAKNK